MPDTNPEQFSDTSSPLTPSYRRVFWRSAPHFALALLTLGLGIASAHPIGLLVGAAAYALGVLYIPDSAWFRNRVDASRKSTQLADDRSRAAAFEQRRSQLMVMLTPERRQRYDILAGICRDISDSSTEAASGDIALSLETRLRRLDELLWTYLRLLSIGQSLEVYLETERRENLPAAVNAAQTEINALEAEAASSPAPTLAASETRKKLLASRRERLLALQQRLERVTQARDNLELTRSEQERLVEQAKLIRADAIANKNADALGARIDLSIEHLAETNHWLNELSEFKDLTGQLPPMPAGAVLAASAATPPPLPTSVRRTRTQTK